MNSGVYVIVNKVNGNLYIGSSIRIKQRLQDHRSGLERGNNPCTLLQRAWNKYGADAFEFYTAELVAPESVVSVEQDMIDAARLAGATLYNARFRAEGNLGNRHTEEAKAKIGKASRERKRSEVTRQRMSLAAAGTKHSKEAREKMSEAARRRGYPVSRALNHETMYLKSPNGEMYAFKCIRWFALEMGLPIKQSSNLLAVWRGRRKSSLGWTRPTTEELNMAAIMG